MSEPDFMSHERIMTGEEYVSYADHLGIVQKLESERDEAIKLAQSFHADQTELLTKIEKLKIERDEAREKIKRQADRIRILEGATNHAGGLYK